MTRLHEVAQNVTSVRDTVAQKEHAKDISERAHKKKVDLARNGRLGKGIQAWVVPLNKSFWLGIGLKE